MSDDGINWYVLIYPAIAIPIAILGVVRWRMIRKRQLAQITQIQQQAAANGNNGLSAQDFILGNPYATPYTAAVSNAEQPNVQRNTKDSFTTPHQSVTTYNTAQPEVHRNTKDIFKDDLKKMQDEAPSMIQTKRWF